MNTLNEFNTVTTPMLERHLAVIQLKHYLAVQQSALDTDNVAEFRRSSCILDSLILEYGDAALYEAEDEML